MKKQIYIKRVQQSTRKTKKGRKAVGRWDVDVDLPALSGVADSRIVGSVMAGEVIDEIRRRWKSGRKVDGSRFSSQDEKRVVRSRKWKRRVLETHGAVLAARRVSARDLRGLGYKAKVYRYVRKMYTLTRRPQYDIGGLKSQPFWRLIYYPKDGDRYTPIWDSGMMVDTLHGRWRGRVRSYMLGKTKINVSGQIMIRVASPRSFAANEVGGLNADSSRFIENFKLKMTRQVMDHVIFWENFGKVGRGFAFVMRTLALATRMMKRSL